MKVENSRRKEKKVIREKSETEDEDDEVSKNDFEVSIVYVCMHVHICDM